MTTCQTPSRVGRSNTLQTSYSSAPSVHNEVSFGPRNAYLNHSKGSVSLGEATAIAWSVDSSEVETATAIHDDKTEDIPQSPRHSCFESFLGFSTNAAGRLFSEIPFSNAAISFISCLATSRLSARTLFFFLYLLQGCKEFPACHL